MRAPLFASLALASSHLGEVRKDVSEAVHEQIGSFCQSRTMQRYANAELAKPSETDQRIENQRVRMV